MTIHIKISNGDGTWTDKCDVLGDVVGVHTNPALTGDFNGDGKMDLVFVGQNRDGNDGLVIRTKISTFTAGF